MSLAAAETANRPCPCIRPTSRETARRQPRLFGDGEIVVVAGIASLSSTFEHRLPEPAARASIPRTVELAVQFVVKLFHFIGGELLIADFKRAFALHSDQLQEFHFAVLP